MPAAQISLVARDGSRIVLRRHDFLVYSRRGRISVYDMAKLVLALSRWGELYCPRCRQLLRGAYRAALHVVIRHFIGVRDESTRIVTRCPAVVLHARSRPYVIEVFGYVVAFRDVDALWDFLYREYLSMLRQYAHLLALLLVLVPGIELFRVLRGDCAEGLAAEALKLSLEDALTAALTCITGVPA